jgi:sulfatase maturation enzyme AslB (radical SAM superfamily)
MSVQAIDPRRYHEAVEATVMSQIVTKDPVCLYLETTNRCNLLCTTCPRTYADLEPQADMTWELFTRIVDQVPNIARVVLHGVGEPMLVKDLPRMIRYLKDRGAYVLFNTNGTVLTARKGRELCDAGLDELRVSLDAADARTFLLIRGKDYFNRIVRNVRAFTEPPARIALAYRVEGNRRSIAGLRSYRPRYRRQGGLPAAPGVLRACTDRVGAARPGLVRAPEPGGDTPLGGSRKPGGRARD